MLVNNRQFQLFDPGPAKTPGPDVTRLDTAQWHGTDMEHWPSGARHTGVAVHSGTPAAAATRGKNLYPVWPSHFVPRRREGSPHPDDLVSDLTANAAHYHHDRDLGLKPSSSVIDSIGGVQDAEDLDDQGPDPVAEELLSGRTIAYLNEVEDAGSTSFVSPAEGYETLDSPSADLGLAKGTQWTPRAHMTHQEARYAGLDLGPDNSRRYVQIREDPRLFETVAHEPGVYYPPSSVHPSATRNHQGDVWPHSLISYDDGSHFPAFPPYPYR